MWSERDRGRERERRDGERVCEREIREVGDEGGMEKTVIKHT